MDKDYFITNYFNSFYRENENHIDIRYYEIEKIKKYKTIIHNINLIEEYYSIVLDSFIEIEEFLILFSLRNELIHKYDYDIDDIFEELRQKLNLKFISFISSSRIYEEHIKKIINKINNISSCNIDISEFFLKEYDNKFSYRMMYNLRNYTMHSELPINIISISNNRIFKDDDIKKQSINRISVNPKIIKDDILQNNKINAKFRNELSSLLYKYIDIKYIIREYITSISNINQSIRNKTNDIFTEAGDFFKIYYNEYYKSRNIEVNNYLYLVERKENIIYLMESIPIQLYNKLHTKRLGNILYDGFKSDYITSEIINQNDTYPQQKDEDHLWIR